MYCIWACLEMCKFFSRWPFSTIKSICSASCGNKTVGLCGFYCVYSLSYFLSSMTYYPTAQSICLGRFPLSPDIWMDHTIISPALKPYAQWLFCLQTSLTGKISNHHGESRCFSFPAFLFFPFFSPPQSTDTDACVQGQYWFLNHLTRAE